MKTLQAMLSTPEIQAITPDKETMKLKKEDLARLLLGFYNWSKEQEKGECSVSTYSEEQQEVDYLAMLNTASPGDDMVSEDEGYASSLLQAEQQPVKKVVKPVTQEKVLQNTTQEKEKQVMKKEAIIVEVHSKEQFVNAVVKAMNEGTILTPQGKPSGINCVVLEKGLNIVVEFTVAKKEDQGIVVKYYLPENFKVTDFVKHFATMMLKNAELMKRSVFNMAVSPRMYDMLKKQVVPAKELAVKGKSGLPIIVKEFVGKHIMMLKNAPKEENEVLISVTKS